MPDRQRVLAMLRRQWVICQPDGDGQWSASSQEPGHTWITHAPSSDELAIKLRYSQRGLPWWNLPGGCDDPGVAAAVAGRPVSAGTAGRGGEGLYLLVSRSGWWYVRPRGDESSWGICAPGLAELSARIAGVRSRPRHGSTGSHRPSPLT